MKKKYIIALEDRNVWSCGLPAKTLLLLDVSIFGTGLAFVNTGIELTPYTEPDMEKIREEAYAQGYSKGFTNAKVQCNIQAEKDLREVGERHYQKGLSDAWEAARKIANMPYDEEEKAFGSGGWAFIEKHTASEAIEKIKQYEQKQEEEITKGDVVRMKSAPEVEILVTYADEMHFSGIALTEVDDSCEIGDQYTDVVIHKVEKTGRHYEIAEVIAKMKEES